MLDMQNRMLKQDGEIIVGTSQDCTPVLEDAKRRHNEGLHGSSELKHAARIPSVIVQKYCNENGVSFADFMADPVHIKRVVEHPDNAMFRIWPGRL